MTENELFENLPKQQRKYDSLQWDIEEAIALSYRQETEHAKREKDEKLIDAISQNKPYYEN